MLGTIFNPMERLAHGWQVLASLLLTGAVTALCYALSQAGLAELAGTAMSFYAVFVGTRVFAKVVASRPGGHFGATSNIRDGRGHPENEQRKKRAICHPSAEVSLSLAQ